MLGPRDVAFRRFTRKSSETLTTCSTVTFIDAKSIAHNTFRRVINRELTDTNLLSHSPLGDNQIYNAGSLEVSVIFK